MKREHMSEDNVQDAVDTATANDVFAQEVADAKYTAEDLTKARKQEKDKVYSTIEKMQQTIAAFEQREQERLALEAEKAAKRAEREAQREAEKKAQEEEEMEVKKLLSVKEREWQSQLEQERAEREKAFALLQREREFQELMSYRSQRIEQERDNIIPQLIDLVAGDSKDEIEQSILGLKERSAKIFEDVAAASQQSRKDMVGTRITVPASGPLDNDSENNPYSTGDVSKMSMADYAKNRAKLLGSASNNRGQGLFGNQ
jgi:hypothetical protein